MAQERCGYSAELEEGKLVVWIYKMKDYAWGGQQPAAPHYDFLFVLVCIILLYYFPWVVIVAL